MLPDGARWARPLLHSPGDGSERRGSSRAAGRERTCERAPLPWPMSTGNQGVALMLIAERLGDSSKARAAVEQIEVALATMREGGHAAFAASYEAQLPRARGLLDRLADG
jgi:hypothetical protein